MSEPRLDPMFSALAPRGQGCRYLGKRGESWHFQIRIPADLDPFRKLGPHRATLGPISIRAAERKARALVAAAEGIFAAARTGTREMENREPYTDKVTATICADPMGFFMALRWKMFLAENLGGQEPIPTAKETADRQLICDLVRIEQEVKNENGSAFVKENAEQLRADLIARYERAIQPIDDKEKETRETIHMSQAVPDAFANRLLSVLDNQNILFERLIARQDSSAITYPSNTPPAPSSLDVPVRPQIEQTSVSIPLFSEAAENYCRTRISANGGIEHADIKSIRSRVKFFLDVAGDKSIDRYTHADFQALVDALQYWPPEPERHEDLAGKSIKEILALNADGKHKYGIMALNTVKGHYLVEMRIILNDACVIRKVPNPVAALKLKMPSIFKVPEKRKPPEMERMTEAFRIALSYGILDHPFLLLLGMLTGRRIGFLPFLRGNHFSRIGEFVVIRIPQYVVDPDTGEVTETPIKTSDALCGIVLHRIFDEIGFVDWAMELGDQYIFRSRHVGVKDPEDAAQKLVNGVLSKAKACGTFHGFRHWYITAMRGESVSDLSRRIQVGHAARDEHERYGKLPISPEDALKIKNMALPPEVDFSLFHGLDFSVLRNGTSAA